MKRSEIKAVLETGKAGDGVTVAGWIKSVRESKSVGFIHLNDGSTFDSIQVLVPAEFPGREKVLKQITGASLAVTGKLIASQGKGQAIELDPSSIDVLGECDPSSPVQKAGTSFEFLRGVANISRGRTPSEPCSASEMSFGGPIRSRGFVMCHSPILTTPIAKVLGPCSSQHARRGEASARPDGRIDFKRFLRREVRPDGLRQLGGDPGDVAVQGYTSARPSARGAVHHAAPRLRVLMIEPELAFADLKDDRTRPRPSSSTSSSTLSAHARSAVLR